MNITKEQLLEYYERLQFVIDTASIFVDPTPDHPEGCARTKWIEQAEFWQIEISKIDLKKGLNRSSAVIVFSLAFCNNFDKTLDCLDVNIPRKSDKEYKEEALEILHDGLDTSGTNSILKTLEKFISENNHEM